MSEVPVRELNQDTAALVKLVRREPESDDLVDFLGAAHDLGLTVAAPDR